MKKNQEDFDGGSVIKAAAIGGGGSVLLSLLLTALTAILVERGTVDIASLDALTAGILILSTVSGSLLASWVTGHHRLVVCMASGVVYFLLLLGGAILLCDGADGAVGVTAMLVLGSSCAAALMGLNERKGNCRHRLRKNRNRKVVQNLQRGN